MQEFMILPVGATSFTEAMRMGTETYHHLSALIKAKYGQDATAVGDEGGFAPNFQNNADAIQLCKDAIEKAGYTGKIKIGMDVAASEFFKDGKYDLDFKNPNSDSSKWLTGKELADVYLGFIKKYPITYRGPLRPGRLGGIPEHDEGARGLPNRWRRPACHQHQPHCHGA